MNTQLLYLEHMQALEGEATIQQIESRGERTVIYLDQTILYPQGGGQPYDQGFLFSDDARFRVDEVRFVDGRVEHIGLFLEGTLQPQQTVRIVVDQARRVLNSRLHSAGHLVDMAVSQLGLNWTPQKGYHFPDSPYVEYNGRLDAAVKEPLARHIEQVGRDIIRQNLPVEARFVSTEELHQLCHHVPTNLPAGKPIRIVRFQDFAIPCGGTHVAHLAELEELFITKLKEKGDSLRVGYNIPRP